MQHTPWTLNAIQFAKHTLAENVRFPQYMLVVNACLSINKNISRFHPVVEVFSLQQHLLLMMQSLHLYLTLEPFSY